MKTFPALPARCHRHRTLVTVAGLSLLLLGGLSWPALSLAADPPTTKASSEDVAALRAEVAALKTQLAAAQSSSSGARGNPSALTMNLSGDVLFEFNKAKIVPAAEKDLNRLAVILSQFPESQATITGYTDNKGGNAVNQELSKARAESVKQWLVTNKAIPATMIQTEGRGEAEPVAPNETPEGRDNPEGRARNRRVEITVTQAAKEVPATGAVR